jgi:hypothetical protein
MSEVGSTRISRRVFVCREPLNKGGTTGRLRSSLKGAGVVLFYLGQAVYIEIPKGQ